MSSFDHCGIPRPIPAESGIFIQGMKGFREYKNYIFDLYGTLIDIHTDEQRPGLWRKLAELYRLTGAHYSARSLQQNYLRICAEDELALKHRTGAEYPEIKLEPVFIRLRDEAGGRSGGNDEAWTNAAANAFRLFSRDRLSLYENTLSTLETLRSEGKRLFLLSNAQAVFTRTELALTGLSESFDDIFLSSDHGIKKPEKAFLMKLLRTHQLDPSETVMIGNDAASDMGVADACGIDGILLNTYHEDEAKIAKRMDECGIGNPERIRVIWSGDVAELLD